MLAGRTLAGVFLVSSATGAAAAPLRVAAELEAAGEVDSNPHREGSNAVQPIEAAGVAKTGGRLRLAGRHGRHALRLRMAGAAKKFFGRDGAEAEDVAVASADARWDVRPSDDGVLVGLRGTYYEAFERTTVGAFELPGGGTVERSLDLDFRMVDGAAQVALLGEGGDRLTASGGWRQFTYKPSADFGFEGPFLSLGWSRSFDLTAEDAGLDADEQPRALEVGAQFGSQLRGYAAAGYTNICPDYEDAANPELCLVRSGRDRRDLFHAASLDLTYTGRQILGARYELHVNDSTSFGESLVRHRLDLTATSALVLGVVATARLLVQLNQFVDPALRAGDRGTFVTIEDEGRNAALLHLTRDLTRGLAIEARYAFYSNEFSRAETSYRRHVATLGLVVRMGED